LEPHKLDIFDTGVSNKEPPDPTTLVLQAQLGKSYGLDLEAQINNLSIDGYTRSFNCILIFSVLEIL